jgi:predicted ATPase
VGDGVATEAPTTGGEGDGTAGRAPMLRSISIAGFKSIRKIENLELRPINVLIGPNGSGKSNFVGVFTFIDQMTDHSFQYAVDMAGGAEKILHFGSKCTESVIFELNSYDGKARFEFRATPIGLAPYMNTYPASAAERWKPPRPFPRRSLAYHFDDTGLHSPMKGTPKVDDNRLLRADGSNLAAFLYLLKERYHDSYDLIRRTIQLVAPFFEDFRLAPRALNPDTIRLEWRHKSSDMYFDVSDLSNGTLRFIALATLFLQPEELRPSVIIVDEADLGLHPAAIAAFAALVRQASFTTQVILATQSSLLLDQFEPEDVLVAERVDGGTTLRRLDAGRLREWLEEYSLGELWEKNELGGRPAPG